MWPISVAELREYAIWGGVPRYWELRRDYPDKETAIRKVLLDPQGPLIEEHQRLLRDDMRDTVQASTLLIIIGNGANKLSEIATRAGKDSSTISEPLSKLRNLGYVSREVPFGESPKKSKKGIYHINDFLLRFHYQFFVPYRSILELGKTQEVPKNHPILWALYTLSTGNECPLLVLLMPVTWSLSAHLMVTDRPLNGL